jgi:hypothetical protein
MQFEIYKKVKKGRRGEGFKFVFILICFLFSINSFSQFKVDAGKDTSYCVSAWFKPMILGADVRIENGTPPYTFAWEYYQKISEKFIITSSDYLNDTTLQSPLIINYLSWPEWRKFILHVNDANGNYAKDSIYIRLSLFAYLTGGQQTRFYIEKGDSILLNFNNTGIGGGIAPLTYHWQPKTFLSNPDSLITWCKPDSSIQYEVVAIDSCGCLSESVLVYDIRVLPDTVVYKPEFAPIGAEWYYNYRESMDGPETGYYLLKSIKDTTIDSKVCRILSHTLMNSKGLSMNKGESILYEDVKENRIYRYLFGNFYLLYDFTKTTGDTIIIKEPYSETQYDSIVTVVDSVGIETVAENIQLKVLYVRSDVGRKYDFQGKIVEKIGNLQYLYPFDQLVCDGGCPLPLRCYNDDQISFVSHEPYAMQVPCDYIYPERKNEFAPIGAEWYYNYEPDVTLDEGYQKITVLRDTIIGNQSCRFLQVRNIGYSYFYQNYYDYEAGIIILYEKDNIVYYYKNNQFYVLYDFAAKAGDSYNSISYMPNCSQTYKVGIDSVTFVEVDEQLLKNFHVTLNDSFQTNYIEKIGYNEYCLPQFGLGCEILTGPHYPGPLRCYSDGDIGVYSTNIVSNCDYITSSIKNKIFNDLKVFPNPADTYITISNPSKIKIKKIELIDFSGRIVQMWDATESTGNTLNIQHISPGIYLLKAETEDGIKTEKLVIQ